MATHAPSRPSPGEGQGAHAGGPGDGRFDRAFWRGRRVFITGHTGFKGSWLCLWLESLGAEVTGYSLPPPTSPSLYEQAGVAKRVNSIAGDIRDLDKLKAALLKHRPEVLMHMAAQSVVKQGYADPVDNYSTNVMGTVNVLEAARSLTERCAVVNVTSDKCYAHRSTGSGYDEDDAMGGDDPYSNSKGCAELVGHSYGVSFFPAATFAKHQIALASARAGNAIGGGDWTANQLVPDLLKAFASSNACPIRSPDAVRPWQFVMEPLRGYLMLAQRLYLDGPAFASGWNFGPADDDAKPVSWIADRLARTWGGDASWRLDRDVHPPEAPMLRLNVAKAATGLGWRPAVPLATTLDWIVEWYRAWHARSDLAAVTLEQIHRYEQLVTSPATRDAATGE